MGKRIDYAARERHAKFREQARAQGKRQLGCWISREAAERLDTLLETSGELAEHIVSAAILAYRNGAARNASSNVSRSTPTVDRNVARNTPNPSGNGQGLSPEVAELVKRWRAEGTSWAECARRLDEQGIPTPRGGPWLQGRGQTNLARYFPKL
jgi:hypothetical protein